MRLHSTSWLLFCIKTCFLGHTENVMLGKLTHWRTCMDVYRLNQGIRLIRVGFFMIP